MTTQTSAEKRRTTRYPLEIRVRIAIVRSGSSKHCYGQANDINDAGIGVFAAIDLEAGEGLALELTPPYHREKLLLRGVVRNRNGFRYGIEFLNLTSYQRKLLAETCKALALVQ